MISLALANGPARRESGGDISPLPFARAFFHARFARAVAAVCVTGARVSIYARFSDGSCSVLECVKHVGRWCIPPKIFESIVRRFSVPVARVHSGRAWSDKRFEHEVMHIRRASSSVGAQTDCRIPCRCRSGFKYPIAAPDISMRTNFIGVVSRYRKPLFHAFDSII